VCSSDLEAAIVFYKEQLGFELIQQRVTTGDKTSMISAVLKAGAIIVVLVQGTTPESQVNRFIANYSAGVQHVAIEVRDLEKTREELAASGVRFATGLIEGNGIRQVFTARDRASGMMLEFIERDTNDGDFTDESVQQLFEQLERNDAY
jgi:4-hydroxyphenylpyruvate dioxygenase-like putative hemolysin